MALIDCLKRIRATEVEAEVAATLAKTYGHDIPVVVQQLVTLYKFGGFVDGYRFLSLDEIEYAEIDLHISFKTRNIIPLVDCGDNDFVVYDYHNEIWMLFNIVEKVSFKKKRALEDLLS